ncbi:MAG: aminotransferase class I/II-fold pyridoxal phosphate-dependent enzyme [Acidobacteria bacterium]|jgi:methionine-gamma-lyase|nr:MAG: aminotransferase class I/II-fold pyridoxal phosphate-dependent enzyme [Acidobacteriota bacterium]GIU82638.1 MAG: L-methionine gamma-lyase [Pyrinomonadaceae bacterium]
MKAKSFFTKAVRAGEELEKNYGAVSVPIYKSAIFAFTSADEAAAVHSHLKDGYFYGRLGNPTQDALEKAIAELEDAEDAFAFASGMGAIATTVLSLVKSGDHIVAPNSMYSTTTLLFKELAEKFKVEATFIDASKPENYEEAIRENTKIFWIETPSNPLLKITDLSKVAEIASRNDIITIADNTFATPFNQRPLNFGIDLVIHSATKYLGGHSDLTAGLVAGRKPLIDRMRFHGIKLYGASIAPDVAWLTLRGIKTLALRVERQNCNAFTIAKRLSEHPKVKAVYYPGLPSHPQHELARKQMTGFGGMVSFDVGSIEAGKRLVDSVKLCILATSLGGVETVIQHSASMTHASLSQEERMKAGITDGLVRLSVGIEDVEDLIEDLEQALEAC